jgi:hypothetical protein
VVEGERLAPFFFRHARPPAGHPRFVLSEKNVDGRGKPGHDGKTTL